MSVCSPYIQHKPCINSHSPSLCLTPSQKDFPSLENIRIFSIKLTATLTLLIHGNINWNQQIPDVIRSVTGLCVINTQTSAETVKNAA